MTTVALTPKAAALQTAAQNLAKTAEAKAVMEDVMKKLPPAEVAKSVADIQKNVKEQLKLLNDNKALFETLPLKELATKYKPQLDVIRNLAAGHLGKKFGPEFEAKVKSLDISKVDWTKIDTKKIHAALVKDLTFLDGMLTKAGGLGAAASTPETRISTMFELGIMADAYIKERLGQLKTELPPMINAIKPALGQFADGIKIDAGTSTFTAPVIPEPTAEQKAAGAKVKAMLATPEGKKLVELISADVDHAALAQGFKDANQVLGQAAGVLAKYKDMFLATNANAEVAAIPPQLKAMVKGLLENVIRPHNPALADQIKAWDPNSANLNVISPATLFSHITKDIGFLQDMAARGAALFESNATPAERSQKLAEFIFTSGVPYVMQRVAEAKAELPAAIAGATGRPA